MKNIMSPIYFILIIVLTGTTILILSLISKDKTKNYIETTANFYDSDKKIIGDDNEYILKYKYTVNGKDYEFTQNVISSTKPISKNETIRIKYNPNNPRQALLYNENPKLGGIIFGAILIIIGIISYIKIKGA